MENFDYSLKSDILFGKDRIQELPDILANLGKKVLFVHDGTSIHKTGLHTTVVELLKDFEIYELSDVKSNPKIDSVREGACTCKAQGVEMVLAVGGGSVLDCAKAVAVGACYEGDPWELVSMQAEPQAGLPVIAVMTLAASGSELGDGAVISNPETNEKIGFISPFMRPKTVVMDPTYTHTVPALHTAAGSADILSHLFETYFTSEDTYLTNLLLESVIKTVVHYAPIAYKEPDNAEARAQLMWAGSLANNGILTLGSQVYAFSVHGIEHEVSAYHDVIHGVGISIITPNWMRYILNDKTVGKFARFGMEVWSIDNNLGPYEIARKAIACVEEFYRSLNLPLHLADVHVDDANFDKIAEQAVAYGFLEYAWVPLNKEDVLNILRSCL